MPRHEFQPGRLVAGLAFVAAGVLYAGDAQGLWEIPWYTAIPLIVAALFLASAASTVARLLHRRDTGEDG